LGKLFIDRFSTCDLSQQGSDLWCFAVINSHCASVPLKELKHADISDRLICTRQSIGPAEPRAKDGSLRGQIRVEFI